MYLNLECSSKNGKGQGNPSRTDERGAQQGRNSNRRVCSSVSTYFHHFGFHHFDSNANRAIGWLTGEACSRAGNAVLRVRNSRNNNTREGDYLSVKSAVLGHSDYQNA